MPVNPDGPRAQAAYISDVPRSCICSVHWTGRRWVVKVARPLCPWHGTVERGL